MNVKSPSEVYLTAQVRHFGFHKSCVSIVTRRHTMMSNCSVEHLMARGECSRLRLTDWRGFKGARLLETHYTQQIGVFASCI